MFTHLFSEPEYRFQLFQALHPEMTDIKINDIVPLTITSVVIDRPYNDLAFLAEDKLLIMVEAQSTWSINILLRLLMYLAQTYCDFINAEKLDIYGSKAISIPEPEFYVIYTVNKRDRPDEISFSKEFFGGKKVAVDTTAKVIYDGEKGDIINQYVEFCRVLDAQYKKYGRTAEAVRETIRICQDRDVLKKYLEKCEREVMDIMLTLFDQETAINNRLAAVTREIDKKARTDQNLTIIKSLMETLKLSASDIMAAMKIPTDQQAVYAAKLQAQGLE